jgi:hypothetical protein
MLVIKIKNFFINHYLANYVDKIEKNISIKSLDKNSKFYIIASKKKRGFFSILLFVINHLKFCDENKLIPIIDMKFHKTLYNEKKILFGTYNSWEYFFKKINNFKIDKIYNSKKFQICKDTNIYTKNNKFNKNLSNTYKKYIKFNDKILIKYNFFKKKFFTKNKNILGIHFRGTDMKYTPNHPLPMTRKQVLYHAKNLMKRYKIKKIFLVTEDIINFRFIMDNFKKENIFHIANFRSSNTKVFDLNMRKSHKFKLGEEALINGLCLSNCDFLLSSQTGIADFAKFINPKIKFFKINNGYNSKKISFSLIKFTLINFIHIFFNVFKK